MLATLHLGQDKQWLWLTTRGLTASDGWCPPSDAISYCLNFPLFTLWRWTRGLGFSLSRCHRCSQFSLRIMLTLNITSDFSEPPSERNATNYSVWNFRSVPKESSVQKHCVSKLSVPAERAAIGREAWPSWLLITLTQALAQPHRV